MKSFRNNAHRTVFLEVSRNMNRSTNSYAMFSVAKDLSLGTNHMTLCDLTDTELIPPKIFAIICNSMAIYRLGLDAIQEAPERKAKSGRKE